VSYIDSHVTRGATDLPRINVRSTSHSRSSKPLKRNNNPTKVEQYTLFMTTLKIGENAGSRGAAIVKMKVSPANTNALLVS
jgi:hypothetical protein